MNDLWSLIFDSCMNMIFCVESTAEYKSMTYRFFTWCPIRDQQWNVECSQTKYLGK